MASEGIFRRRLLPHWDVAGKPVFITGCLYGSLPAAGLARVKDYRRQLDTRRQPHELSTDEWGHLKQKLLFAFVDQLLDHESPVQSLADPRQAEIVQNAFLHFANERYTLLAFVVMPSHHHWLFLPHEDKLLDTSSPSKQPTPREQISHSVQSYTANACNRIRGQTGAYWQRETFDHWARDEAEMVRIIRYIEKNPVQAGLVDRPEAWPWSSAHLRNSTGIKQGEALHKPAK